MPADQGDEDSRETPLNREPEPRKLLDSFLTPTAPDSTSQPSVGYDRNHGPIPQLSFSDHKVTVDGLLVPEPVSVTPRDLATSFPQHRVTCALQCAGNRRHAMRTRLAEVQGIDWFDGAILNAEWEGPRLRDVLLRAGVPDDAGSWDGLHVQLACYQAKTQEDDWYGGSISLDRAMSEEMEVVLALKMNGETLTQAHGYPVRAVVPGVIGARSVKWLDRISVSTSESPNFYQRHDYKVLPPEVTDTESAEKYWDKVPPMEDNPINSVVANPEDGEAVKVDEHGRLKVKGYAVPGGSGGPIVEVEVAVVPPEKQLQKNDEVRWVKANLGPASRWSWVIWEAELVDVPKGEGMRIFSRATDREGNVQDQEQTQWNLRGVGYNAIEGPVGLKIL